MGVLAILMLASSCCADAGVVEQGATPVAVAPQQQPARGASDVVRAHAERAERAYLRALDAALAMRAAIRDFCAAPSEQGLSAARAAWIAARRPYGATEAYRFGGGPIDSRRGGRETWLNAWPVDEAFIEPVDRTAPRGIIGDASTYPALGRAILRLHNQRGGETNVCTGWHAIEFMLWGEDRDPNGPGARPAADFMDSAGPRAARRREYLLEITDLLCEDLSAVASEWRRDGGAYRARFESDPGALRAILAGPALLCGFEMAGERMAVAFEMRDQEEEHSCFSDTTHLDFLSNLEGVESVLVGNGSDGAVSAIRAVDPGAAQAIVGALARAKRAVAAVPAPFDRAIQGADGSDERARLKEAIEALEALSESIGAGARAIGVSVPTEPQG
jgi:putative iron-regulated protein